MDCSSFSLLPTFIDFGYHSITKFDSRPQKFQTNMTKLCYYDPCVDINNGNKKGSERKDDGVLVYLGVHPSCIIFVRVHVGHATVLG